MKCFQQVVIKSVHCWLINDMVFVTNSSWPTINNDFFFLDVSVGLVWYNLANTMYAYAYAQMSQMCLNRIAMCECGAFMRLT